MLAYLAAYNGHFAFIRMLYAGDFCPYACFYVISFYQYYVKNLKTLWHTATYVYNSPLRCTLQHLADDIENS